MITKPEDAMPHTVTVKIDRETIGPEELTQYADRAVVMIDMKRELHGENYFFTAAECVEIARAYAEICGAYINATNKEKEQAADDEMSRWEAKFAEWETNKNEKP